MINLGEALDAGGRAIDRLDLAEDAYSDLGSALCGDVGFLTACYTLECLQESVDHEHATQADRDARDALERSVREHAQRVQLAEVDANDPTTWGCHECGDQLATDADHGFVCLTCGEPRTPAKDGEEVDA